MTALQIDFTCEKQETVLTVHKMLSNICCGGTFAEHAHNARGAPQV